MFKPLFHALTIAVFIIIIGCKQINTEQTEAVSQQNHSNTQATMVDHVITDTNRHNHDEQVLMTQEAEAHIKHGQKQLSVNSADMAASPASEAVSPAYTVHRSKRILMHDQSVLNTIRYVSESTNREKYAHFSDNPIKLVTEQPVSTFSIDVDTGAYANVRRMLNAGQLPIQDAVRAEELINYFSYQYPDNRDNNSPFAVVKEIAPSPWSKNNYLLHLGIKAQDKEQTELPNANLVFLIDVSGSMQSPKKIELLKSSLVLLSGQLSANDKVSIVVYAGASGVVLPPTQGNQTATIQMALNHLTAGGSTNGAAGIKLAYSLAQQEFIKGGINRVILATDGDFNVGTVNHEQLMDLIERKRQFGISLSTLGFGTGNYNDQLMEQLADKGNGNYAYIDTLNEAQKVLVDEMSSTLLTVAKDVKIQIEFNPAAVSEYRLIGYENRHLKREDFNNDKIDAGEIGAGHTVTAIYEIKLNDGKAGAMDPLRYQPQTGPKTESEINEIAFLKIRYKKPDENASQLLSWPIKQKEIIKDIAKTSDDFRFSAAVAAFAQQLRGGDYLHDYDYDDMLTLARNARGEDRFGYRGEFLSLVNLAKSLGTVASHNRSKDISLH